MNANQTPQPDPQGPVTKEAYPITPRMRLGSQVAMACAVLLMLGLVGGQIAVGSESTDSPFYMATKTSSYEFEAVGPGWGYLVGPLLILGAMTPLVQKRRFLFKDDYASHLVRAIVLWVLGILVAVGSLIYMVSEDYEIKGGTAVVLVLLVLGLIATIEVWPFGVRAVEVEVDAEGNPVGGADPS